MDFAHEQQFTAKKAGGIGMVVLTHALLLGGLIYGLHSTIVTPKSEPPIVVIPPNTPKIPPETMVENKLKPISPTTITRPELPKIEPWKEESPPKPVDGPTPGPVTHTGDQDIVVGGGGNGLVTAHPGVNKMAKADFESCKPTYPRSALLEGDEGIVRLRMEIGADGHLLSSAVVQSSGYPVLDKAALNALNKCTFEAAVQDGTPVRSTFVTDYIWSLEHQ
jgi:protein TonB